jgi:hypothetical protein
MKKAVLVLLTLTIALSSLIVAPVPVSASKIAQELVAIPKSAQTPTCKHPSIRYEMFSIFYDRYPSGKIGRVEKGFYFCNVCNLAVKEKLKYLDPMK